MMKPVSRACGFAVLEHDDAGDILGSRDVRDVERLDPFGEIRQFEQFLQLFEHLGVVGLEDSEPLLKRDPCIGLDKLDHALFGPAFWIEDVDTPTAAFGEQFFQDGPVFEIVRHMDLERDIVGRIILDQHAAEKLRSVKIVALGQVFPKELTAADDPAFAHGEKLQRKPLTFAVVANDVDVAFGGRRHLLRFAQSKNGAVKVSVFRRQLVLALVRILPHSFLERTGKFLVSALEQYSNIRRGLSVFALRTEAFDAWAETAFQVIFETRARQLAVDLDLACPKLECAIDQI